MSNPPSLLPLKTHTLLLLLTLLLVPDLGASSFNVSPTRVAFSAKRSSTIMRVMNFGDEPVTIQAHVVAWTLQDNQDTYAASDDVVLNPPIFSLDPKQIQLLRLGLRRPNLDEREAAYRVILEEVPAPPEPGTITLRYILRLSVPIFVAPRGATRMQLVWKAEVLPGQGLKIIATNQGNVHVQVKDLALSSGAGPEPFASKRMLDYLLPGKTQEWAFESMPARAASTLALTAATDAGNFRESLSLTNP